MLTLHSLRTAETGLSLHSQTKLVSLTKPDFPGLRGNICRGAAVAKVRFEPDLIDEACYMNDRCHFFDATLDH